MKIAYQAAAPLASSSAQGNTMGISRLCKPTFALLLLPAIFVGCATQGGHQGQMDHHASNMDMASMCTMHKQMMEGKTAAQQQALMDEHMKSMTPEMRKRMQEMHASCK